MEQRKCIVERVNAEVKKQGHGRLSKHFWQSLAANENVAIPQLKKYCSPKQQQAMEEWLTKHSQLLGRRRCGRRCWAKKFTSQATGSRTGKRPGPPLAWKEQLDAVRAFVKKELSFGHQMEKMDLFLAFATELEDLKWKLQNIDTRSPEETKTLEAVNRKLQYIQTKAGKRDCIGRLCAYCEVSVRKPQDVSKLTEEEKATICQLSWQSWDNLVWLIAFGSEEQLGKVVADPKSFIQDRQATACVFTDAVPVYLHVTPGTVLIPKTVLEARNARRRRGGPPTSQALAVPEQVAGGGQSGDIKDRVTWLCRQRL